MDVANWIGQNLDGVVSVALGVVGLASAIAALTPTPKDDGIAAALVKGVNWLALNVGQAKNANQSGSE